MNDYKVVIIKDGQTYEYYPSNGTDKGDFTSFAGFTQRSVAVKNPAFPNFTVMFRPDRNSTRMEVVFELGNLLTSTPHTIGSYTAQVYKSGQKIFEQAVPLHYFRSRWRYQSSPRPIVNSVSTLISQGKFPPLNGNLPIEALHTASATYSPMELAGVTAYMPMTGEREDIGIVTGPQGEYIAAGNAAALATTMAQAEASGTINWHYRDDATGAPVDFTSTAMRDASWYEDSRVGSPHIYGSLACPNVDATSSYDPGCIVSDEAHTPALAYVPYMLTGDPYYLEELQFAYNFAYGNTNPGYRHHGLQTSCNFGQMRAHAWTFRSLMQLSSITPANAPSWMLPKSYFDQLMNEELSWYTKSCVNSTSVIQSVFRTSDDLNMPELSGYYASGVWQDEFEATILGWAVAMGHTEWQPAFAWKIGSTIARTNGTSGWQRQASTPYRMIMKSPTSNVAASWADAFALTNALYAFPITTANQTVVDLSYFGYTRGALVYAKKLGIPQADTSLQWMNGVMSTQGIHLPAKWSLDTP